MFLDVAQLKNILIKEPFSLFELSPNFDIKPNELQAQYLELQRQFHPDNYVLSDPEQKTYVAQLSTYINQSYTSLKNPLLRGILLLKNYNIILDLAKDTILPNHFLIEQMEFHEAIDAAKSSNDLEQLNKLEEHSISTEKKLIKNISVSFKNNDLQGVQELLKQLAFYNRLKNTLNNAIESLD